MKGPQSTHHKLSQTVTLARSSSVSRSPASLPAHSPSRHCPASPVSTAATRPCHSRATAAIHCCRCRASGAASVPPQLSGLGARQRGSTNYSVQFAAHLVLPGLQGLERADGGIGGLWEGRAGEGRQQSEQAGRLLDWRDERAAASRAEARMTADETCAFKMVGSKRSALPLPPSTPSRTLSTRHSSAASAARACLASARPAAASVPAAATAPSSSRTCWLHGRRLNEMAAGTATT